MTSQADGVRVKWLWSPESAPFVGFVLDGPDLPGAACAGSQAALFDDRQDRVGPAETPTDRAQRHRLASRICFTQCPVQAECLAARLANGKLGPGIWGGELFEDMRYTRTCPCGCSFTTASKHQRHCDDRCRKREQERRRRARRKEEVAA